MCCLSLKSVLRAPSLLLDEAVEVKDRSRCTALLLAGWLIAQLNWKIETDERDSFKFSSPEAHGELRFIARETEGIPVSECALCVGKACYRIGRDPGSEFLHADICTPDGCELHHLLPAGKGDVIHLLNEELMLGGKHQVYLRALAAMEQLWEKTF